MISLGKMGCGRAALRGGSSSGSSSSSRALRRSGIRLRVGGRWTSESRPGQLFSMAKPPGGAGSVPWKEEPFSALAMGQQAQQGATRQVLSGKGTLWETVRHAMTKQRRVPILNTHTNLSNQCGHMSFVILALAYLETDVLALRGYAASGIGLSILFQFYRPQPLWIPIGWNGLFLLINTSMIGLLLRERSEAANIGDDPEQAKTFEEVFKRVELSPVDFVRLMDVAERRVVPKGARLSEEGRVQEEVFLIVEGAAEVEAEGAAVGHLEQKQFVGSMAFNRFIQASPAPASTAPPSEAPLAAAADPPEVNVRVRTNADGSTSPTTTTTITITTDNNSAGSGDSRASPLSLGGKGNGKGYVNNDFMGNGDRDDDEEEEEEEEDMYAAEDNSYVPGGGGVFEEAKEVAMNVLRRESIVGNIAMAQSFVLDAEGHRRHGVGQMERSGTTVTATTEMVVYAWNMHLLRAFIKRRSLAGAGFMKAISADLIRKVDQSRGAEERYRMLLAEALDGGVITPIEKKKLHRYRDIHGISAGEHKELLKEHEWREEEFDAGFQKGVAPRDGSKHFLAYEALVRRELAKGEVQDKGRQNLRRFRAKAGIEAQEHLLALEKQGWTADDYELGGKGKAAAAGLAENSAKSDDINIIDDDTDASSSPDSNSDSNITVKIETTAVEAEVEAKTLGDAAKGKANAKTKTEGGVELNATADRKPPIDFPAQGAQQILRKASAPTSTGTPTAPKLSAAPAHV